MRKYWPVSIWISRENGLSGLKIWISVKMDKENLIQQIISRYSWRNDSFHFLVVQKGMTSRILIVGYIVILEFHYISFYQMKLATLLDNLFHLQTCNMEMKQTPSCIKGYICVTFTYERLIWAAHTSNIKNNIRRLYNKTVNVYNKIINGI